MTTEATPGNADGKMTEVPPTPPPPELTSASSLVAASAACKSATSSSPPRAAPPPQLALQIDKSIKSPSVTTTSAAAPPMVPDNELSGSQRVFKKSSPNSMLTLYLPTRDLVSCNGKVEPLRGVLHVDKDFAMGHRIYGQLTLTFRYGREDEEVMGLRFCNEAVMCLTQIYPQISDKHEKDGLTPLQDALIKRLGDGALPFSVEINPQAPPSVQLVPAKRYYGAPIGTSYDVRCYVADRSDEKLHRRSMVRMSVRVIQKTDLNAVAGVPPENSATLENNATTGGGGGGVGVGSGLAATNSSSCDSAPQTPGPFVDQLPGSCGGGSGSGRPLFHSQTSNTSSIGGGSLKSKAERADSFTKLKLSPKAFRFTGKLCRSKSEIEKDASDTSYALNQIEMDQTSGPQGAVDKPFLLQDGRVGLRASLDRSIYGHGEEVTVTVHIRNDSRKTVRRIRVFAIQHVDVCMFNNGKFKNIVADIDQGDHAVGPGASHHTTYKLVPKRGQTKNWIALEDSLQRCNDPDEIKSNIASSALRSPNYFFDDKNVFAIYVSYYVKVKLTLSGMGGELSLKLPFTLAHFDDGNGTPSAAGVVDEVAATAARDHQDGQQLLLLQHPQSVVTTEENNGTGIKSSGGTGTNLTTTKEQQQQQKADNHDKNSNGTKNNNNTNNHGSCSSYSSSSGKSSTTAQAAAVAAGRPTIGKGQVSRDTIDNDEDDDEDDDDDEGDIRRPSWRGADGGVGGDATAPLLPSLTALRQRRFSQARQEAIRPEDDSLDRIETLSDDGEDVNLGAPGHGLVIVGDEDDNNANGNAKLRGIGCQSSSSSSSQLRTNEQRKLDGSSVSLEETELLDEVFCDTLTIGQQQQQQSHEQARGGPQQTGVFRVIPPQSSSSAKTSSSLSTSSSSSVMKGSGSAAAVAQLEHPSRHFNSSEEDSERQQCNEESSSSTTLVQIHAPQS